ncbi:MAG: dTMP kinase [Gammaproteobacteria bacterium]|nr:dTMP kinase [Gammaproteobacteria bacterium]
MRGRFITIEGVEGVGKSTNIAFIQSILDGNGIPFLATREPGGTELGEGIRKLLLDKRQRGMTAVTELLLLFAARAQHVEQVIKPALAVGQWVICDRFTDSSYAYQGGGRELPIELITSLEKLAINDFRPDCTFILDMPVETGLSRAENIGEKDRFESEQTEFFNRVREVFITRAKEDKRFHIVDAAQDLEQVQAEIRDVLIPLMDGH